MPAEDDHGKRTSDSVRSKARGNVYDLTAVLAEARQVLNTLDIKPENPSAGVGSEVLKDAGISNPAEQESVDFITLKHSLEQLVSSILSGNRQLGSHARHVISIVAQNSQRGELPKAELHNKWHYTAETTQEQTRELRDMVYQILGAQAPEDEEFKYHNRVIPTTRQRVLRGLIRRDLEAQVVIAGNSGFSIIEYRLARSGRNSKDGSSLKFNDGDDHHVFTMGISVVNTEQYDNLPWNRPGH